MAAADQPRKRLREETTCAVCLNFFSHPVTVECGHNFCKGCVLKCWKTMPSALCPQCRKTIKQRCLKVNWQLASIVDIAKQLSDQGMEEAVAGALCESHQEPLKFFCKDDDASICVVCERSKGHREHHVVPVEEAAEECKDQIRTSLDNLRRKKEELLATKDNARKQSQDLLNLMARERQKAVAAFKHLREFLEEEENSLLAQMEEVDKEVMQKRDEDIARLSEELSSLEKTIREMEEECEKPPRELLKNIASKLQRCEQKEKLETPAPFPPAIKWRIWDFWDANSILENATKTLKDNLKCRTPQHKETVTLDPKTAHPQLLISEDGTSLTLGDQQQSPPDGVWRCVLGSQDFWTGRHYWDIDVGQGEGWAIGVSIRRVHYDQDKPFGPETGLWALGKWEGQYRAVSPPLNPPLALSEEPKKIRVSLNCLGRQVTFFDAETAALLHACPISVGCVYIYYPFLCLWEKSCLTLDP